MLFTSPLSVPDVGRKHEFVGALLSSCGPSLLSTSLIARVDLFKIKSSRYNAAYSALRLRFSHLQRRARKLEVYNDIHKQQQVAARAEIALLEDELQTSRVKLYEEKEQRRKDLARIKEADDRIEGLLGKLQRYGDFIRILSRINLDNPLYRGALSVLSNAEAEDALVTAIAESAKDKTSPWARIIPAVVGPRSPDNYVSALNLTLRTRKDLRERERVCEFWKAMAKMDPENVDVVTPSSSVSDNQNDWVDELECKKVYISKTDCKQSPTAVDDMLECLKNDASFNPGDSTSHSESPHKFEAMAEWVASEAKEETTALPSVSPCVTDAIGKIHFNNSAATDSAGTLKSITNEIKGTPRRAARGDNHKDDVTVLRPSALSALDKLLASAQDFNAMDTDCNAALSVTGLDAREASSQIFVPSNLISGTHAPSGDSSFAEEDSPGNDFSREEIFIVKAGEDIPQLSIQHMLDHRRSLIPFSVSDSGVRSSGSEYSELSALNRDESLNSGGYSCGGTGKQKQLSANINYIDQHTLQASLMKPNSANIKQKPVELVRRAGSSQLHLSIKTATKIAPATGRSNRNVPQINAFSSRYPSSMHKFVGRTPGTGSTLPRPQSIALCDGSPPSTPRLSKTISLSPRKFLPGATPSNSAVAPYIARKNLRTLATSPTKSLRCAAPRIHSSSPPTTMIQSLQASVKSIPCWPPLVEPTESLKLALPLVTARSRLSPLRPDVTKRPIPQKLCAKLSPGREKVEHHSLVLTSHVNVSLATKPSARDLGKRRGVIMMEKLDIGPNTHKQKVVENTVIVPTTGQIEFHKIPVFYPSTSEYAVATKSDPVQIDSSVGTNARNRSNNNENVDDLISELDPAPSEPLHANACASLDLSKIDTRISNLVDSMSDSNLDSLEMTQKSDSDSEMEYSGLPTVEREPGVFSNSLNALPAFCRTFSKDAAKTLGAGVNNTTRGCNDSTFEGALQSAFDASSFSQVNFKGFPSTSLISATFGHRRSGTSSSSSSSSHRSSELLFSRESPIRSISAVSPPLFGLTKHHNRSSNTLSRQDINKKDLGSERPSSSQTTLPAATHSKKTSVFSKQDTSCLQSNVSTSSQTSNLPTTPQKEMEEKEDQAINPPSMSPKRPACWNEKVTRLPMRSKPNAISDQTLSPSPIQSVPESELSLGQNISNESLSPKVKPTSVGNPSSFPIVIPYLALNRSHSSQFKPRSNTIHAHLSSPSRSLVSGSLVPPSPPTKPRSNTVNTYSPINRSPLSQHVMNNSVDFQSRLNDSKTSPLMPLPTSHQRTSIQKLAASKLAKSISKSIPLRVTKKSIAAGPTAFSRPSPPTAAFMVPNKPISTGRRTGSSVAPLIPNCPTSSNGVISPSQCRSLLHNSLSMVR